MSADTVSGVAAPARQLPAPLTTVRDARRATHLVNPRRGPLLAHIAEPTSAAALAHKLGLPRQRLTYHLRALDHFAMLSRIDDWQPPRQASRLGQSAQRFLDRHPPGLIVLACAQEAEMLALVRRFLTMLAVLTLTPAVAPAVPAESGTLDEASAAEAFEKLRALAGTWTFTTAADHGSVSYELVSNGTAIFERVMNVEHGETGMVSVIFREGDRLVLQHFCSSGNQPRLVSAGLEGHAIRFTFERASNLASPGAGHIHGAVFEFPTTGAFKSHWTWRVNGVETTSTRHHKARNESGRTHQPE
jgi:hypothetical protein